mmetsp:Transcript_91156/g.244061  ORF Transcript_91156/g.244061 Transcript_91156/m.244061 type:complete len:483 (+) Transcript_91156:558-2006(+)
MSQLGWGDFAQLGEDLRSMRMNSVLLGRGPQTSRGITIQVARIHRPVHQSQRAFLRHLAFHPDGANLQGALCGAHFVPLLAGGQLLLGLALRVEGQAIRLVTAEMFQLVGVRRRKLLQISPRRIDVRRLLPRACQRGLDGFVAVLHNRLLRRGVAGCRWGRRRRRRLRGRGRPRGRRRGPRRRRRGGCCCRGCSGGGRLHVTRHRAVLLHPLLVLLALPLCRPPPALRIIRFRGCCTRGGLHVARYRAILPHPFRVLLALPLLRPLPALRVLRTRGGGGGLGDEVLVVGPHQNRRTLPGPGVFHLRDASHVILCALVQTRDIKGLRYPRLHLVVHLLVRPHRHPGRGRACFPRGAIHHPRHGRRDLQTHRRPLPRRDRKMQLGRLDLRRRVRTLQVHFRRDVLPLQRRVQLGLRQQRHPLAPRQGPIHCEGDRVLRHGFVAGGEAHLVHVNGLGELDHQGAHGGVGPLGVGLAVDGVEGTAD